ncbi:MAG: phage tail protein, partial [Verrucomicrobiia bacterium]
MSILAAPTPPANASRRMTNSARIASNVLGTPWPVLWGTRDLSGTLVAWTNHTYNSSGSSGKGGGIVSGGERDYRTFALGLCIGPVDSINAIWYDNQLIWTGNVTIASAATTASATQGVGSVILTDNAQRGTICFYFGLDTQTQDPILAQFIPNAPFYRGMCYAVFHGPRPGTKGFRIGSADTLCQIAVNVTRIPPAPPGTPFSATVSPNPGNAAAEGQSIAVATNVSAFTGGKTMFYSLTAEWASNLNQLNVSWTTLAGTDTPGSALITSGIPFAVGSLGLMVTLTWSNYSTPPVVFGDAAQWSILVTSNAAAANSGANVAAMIYELLTSTVSGFALNPALLDVNQFNAFAVQANYAGLNYMTTEKADARNLIKDILGNVQGALTISNGLIAPRLMGYLPGNVFVTALTLEADDIVGYKIRPGAWYELPHHVTVKYRDAGRFYRDTTLSLPGAGDVGDDEKAVEFDLPMVTNLPTARLIGLRMKALEALPKKPDTLICGRSAFPIQFGDIISLNAPTIGTLPAAFGYQPGNPLVVLAVREKGPGDETIEIDVAPDVFGYLPVVNTATGSGGEGVPVGPATPFNRISVQDAFECPHEFATDGSKRFVLFAARTDPDAQGFSLWDSIENPPVDYTEADSDALFHPGGTILDSQMPLFTMDRSAYIDFNPASQDIDSWQSVNDNGWFSYQFLILIGSGDTASLYAAEELIYLGSNTYRIQGIYGPLSDTLPNNAPTGDIWIFAVQPLYNILGQPAWVLGTTVSFKGIPFGSRLSPTLAEALAAQAVVENRALCPRAAVNPNANGLGAIMNPTYSSAGTSPASDIALAWDLCNRPFGFGAETNPCEFDPAIASEVTQCQVDVIVGGTVVRTATVAVRTSISTTVASGAITSQTFPVSSASNIQAGDRISVVHAGGEWFGRVASISAATITLVSPLTIIPSSGDV